MDFSPVVLGKNCVGTLEANLDKIPPETCQKICAQLPWCRAVVMNNQGFCYVKGNHDETNIQMHCISTPFGDESYLKNGSRGL